MKTLSKRFWTWVFFPKFGREVLGFSFTINSLRGVSAKTLVEKIQIGDNNRVNKTSIFDL